MTTPAPRVRPHLPLAPAQSLRDHERRTQEQIAGIETKIQRLQEALAFRRAALNRVRANLAGATPAQRGPASNDT